MTNKKAKLFTAKVEENLFSAFKHAILELTHTTQIRR